jgi:hypothetical protein
MNSIVAFPLNMAEDIVEEICLDGQLWHKSENRVEMLVLKIRYE